jgi:predicted transcriptional regulator
MSHAYSDPTPDQDPPEQDISERLRAVMGEHMLTESDRAGVVYLVRDAADHIEHLQRELQETWDEVRAATERYHKLMHQIENIVF